MTAVPILEQPVGGTPSFFGRERALRTIRNGLARGRSFGLIGGPGVGRTSTLMELAARERRRWSPTFRGTKILPVIVDLSSVGGAIPGAFADAIWQALGNALMEPRVRGASGALTIDKLSFRGEPKRVWEVFEEGLRELWKQLRGTEGWCQYALFLDNAEALAEERAQHKKAYLASAKSFNEMKILHEKKFDMLVLENMQLK